jgi:hypothetical protein
MRSLHAISEDLKNLMRQHGALSGTESINIFKLPRATGQWLLEQNRVLNTLIRVKAMQRPSGETNPDK